MKQSAYRRENASGVLHRPRIPAARRRGNDISLTKLCQPFVILKRDSALCIGIDQSLFFKQHHRLVDALARGTHQISNVALRQYNADLRCAIPFVSILLGECQ